jgi:phosphopantothenoylcysteine decarboxylase/phosphopantothenate--cysteine ligase
MVIKAAAVADFRPVRADAGKLRRGAGLSLELEPTEDILAAIVAQRRAGTLVIGFAAEMEDAVANGRRKLQRKGLDALFVNDVSRANLGFDADENAGWWLTQDESIEFPPASKRQIARQILDRACALQSSGAPSQIVPSFEVG